MELGRVGRVDPRSGHGVETVAAVDDRRGVTRGSGNSIGTDQQGIVASPQRDVRTGGNSRAKGNGVVASAGINRHLHLVSCHNGESIIAGTRIHVDSSTLQRAEVQIARSGGTVDGGQGSEVTSLERKRGIPRDVEGCDHRGTSKSKAALITGSVHGNGRGTGVRNNGLFFGSSSVIPGPIDIDGQGMIGLVIGDGDGTHSRRRTLDGNVGQALALELTVSVNAVKDNGRHGGARGRNGV